MKEKYAILDANQIVNGIFFNEESDAKTFIDIYGDTFSYKKLKVMEAENIDDCINELANELNIKPKKKLEEAYSIKEYDYANDDYIKTNIYFSDIDEAEKFANKWGNFLVGKKEYVSSNKIYSSVDEFFADKDNKKAQAIYDYYKHKKEIEDDIDDQISL